MLDKETIKDLVKNNKALKGIGATLLLSAEHIGKVKIPIYKKSEVISIISDAIDPSNWSELKKDWEELFEIIKKEMSG